MYMRQQSREFLAKFFEGHPKESFKKVLDVGSLDVSGTISDMFDRSVYWGVDMREGNGVSEVVNGHDLIKHFGKNKFDLVLCFDTLEHDDAFWETVKNMRGVLKKGGWLVIGVPSRHCPEHDHPHDFWRFMPQMMKEIFLKDYLFIETQVDMNGGTEDEIYGVGQKP